MINVLIGVGAIIGTVSIYWGARVLNRKWPHPLTLPILVSSIVIVGALLLFSINYETYHIGGQWLEKLLGPAVVALAVPLYKQRASLKKFALPLLVGVSVGSLLGIGSGLLLTKWLDFSDEIIYSMIPKSVTTPVAIEVIDTLGGIPTLAAVLVIIAGIIGAVVHDSLFRFLKLDHFLGRGVDMGCASHAIGTARSMEISEQEGVVSTVAMTISAVVVSVLAPVMVWVLM